MSNLAALQTVASNLATALTVAIPTESVSTTTVTTSTVQSTVQEVSTATGTVQTGCQEAGWFAMLLLCVPLLWYLLFLPILRAWNRVLDAREEWTEQEMQTAVALIPKQKKLRRKKRIGMDMKLEGSAPAPAVKKRMSIVGGAPGRRTSMVSTVKLVQGTGAGAVKPMGKRYKWRIEAADAYIWGFAGGAAPMRVDFGVKGAPPSAPKLHADTKVKVEASEQEVKMLERADAEHAEKAAEKQEAMDAKLRAEEAAAAKLRAQEEVFNPDDWETDTDTDGDDDDVYDAGETDTEDGWEYKRRQQQQQQQQEDDSPAWLRALRALFAPCCVCLRCLGRFLNDLAHFIAFYCNCCIAGGCIVDEHEERKKALQRHEDALAAGAAPIVAGQPLGVPGFVPGAALPRPGPSGVGQTKPSPPLEVRTPDKTPWARGRQSGTFSNRAWAKPGAPPPMPDSNNSGISLLGSSPSLV